MQYLLKISIENTNCWRLIAVDGQADLAHVAELIALAFDYEASKQSFIVKDKIITCGKGGEPLETRELNAFDSLNISLNEEFYFQHESNKLLKHKVLVMKKEDHLYGKWEFPGGRRVGLEDEKKTLDRAFTEDLGIKTKIKLPEKEAGLLSLLRKQSG